MALITYNSDGIQVTTLQLTPDENGNIDAFELLKHLPLYVDELSEEGNSEYVNDQFTRELINPLFASDIVDAPDIPSIDIYTTVVPVFVRNTGVGGISEYRDPGEINVPTIQKGSDFWQTLFRDAFGTEYNHLILNTYNKLAQPIIDEIGILYSNIFTDLANLYSDPIQQEPRDGEDEQIVEEKLTSTYTIINYRPVFSELLESWSSSMYVSGQVDDSSRTKEINLYKVQDVKYELLRRKFAGSETFYNLLLGAINRSGAYIPAIPLKNTPGGQAALFQDNRLIRVLNMPGITTLPSTETINPRETFSDIIPLSYLTVMYYHSVNYDSDAFIKSPDSYLRHKATSFAWDNLKGIIDAGSVVKTYPKLDQGYYLDQLDTETVDDPTDVIRLDNQQSLYDLTKITAGLYEIQADQLLYHQNTIQKSRGHEYPFFTYTFGNDYGPTMMDLPWLNYLERATDQKKKVQEELKIGVSISRAVETPAGIVEENIPVLTFSTELTGEISSHQEYYTTNCRYAYIWNINITYNASTFEVVTRTPSLLTYLLLKYDMSGFSKEEVAAIKAELDYHASYTNFTEYSVGVLPFSYDFLTTSEILRYVMIFDPLATPPNTKIRDDFVGEELTEVQFLFTSHEPAAISKRYQNQSPSYLTGEASGAYWSHTPIVGQDVKHIIYGIYRPNPETGIAEWRWSDPIRVYKKLITTIEEYHPDWMNLIAYFNPYLNFRKNSASPGRSYELEQRALRPAIPSIGLIEEPSFEASDLIGPSDRVALKNLILTHNMDVYINESGSDQDENYPRGMYLRKIRPASLLPNRTDESFAIWGDNRALWGSVYTGDPADNWLSDYIRDRITTDDFTIECLYLERGLAYHNGEPVDSYYVLAPTQSGPVTADWANWVWNDIRNNGFIFCLDLTLRKEMTGEIITLPDHNQMFVSRYEVPVADEVHAEFEAWYDYVEGKLKATVYPTGRSSDGIVFAVELETPDILEQQTQTTISYRWDYADSTYEVLNCALTIVADQLVATSYYVTVRTDDINNTYEVYETGSDFNIFGLTPLITLDLPTITGYDYNVGYETEAIGFRLGKLIKNCGQTACTLGGINLFNRAGTFNATNYSNGFDPLEGYIYDVRLYNRGAYAAEALNITAGTRHELYSYSPSTYKLLYHKFSDYGIVKKTLVPGEPLQPGRIRVFTRSVWDSILLDMYSYDSEETNPSSLRYRADWRDPITDPAIYDQSLLPGTIDYVDGVVERFLVNDYEVLRDITLPAGIDIFYRGSEIVPESGALFDIIQTTIYPIQYKDEAFASGAVITRDEDDPLDDPSAGIYSFKAYHDMGGLDPSIEYLPDATSRSINIPSTPSGDTLSVSTILDLNFTIRDSSRIDSPFITGNNIVSEWIPATQLWSGASEGRRYLRIQNTSMIDIEGNYVRVPMYILNQGAAEADPMWEGRVAGLILDNVKLGSLSLFLNASTYYTELQIPYAYDDQITFPVTGVGYTSRWDAIRTLKEGEYYFTCKYPVQIYPFDNVELDKMSLKGNPTVMYAAVRFKIVVRGTPKYYTESLAYDTKWEPSVLESNLVEYSSPDNRNFPHRDMKIDLFYMDNTSSGWNDSAWRWERIASNWDDSVQLIDSVTAPIYLESSVHAFFTKNGKAPFFVRGENDAPKSEIYDVIVKNKLSEDIESFVVTSSTGILLKSDTTYQLVIDYDPLTTEVAFSPTYYLGQNIDSFQIDSTELAGYNSVVNILQSQDAFYNDAASEDLRSLMDSDIDLSATKTGYAISDQNAWIAPNTNIAGNNLSLGNPYETASTSNLLPAKMPAMSALDIGELFFFIYRQQDVAASCVLSPKLFGSFLATTLNVKLPVISYTGRNGYLLSLVYINEYNILKSIFISKKNTIIDALGAATNTSTSGLGLITGISSLQPLIKDYISYARSDSITTSEHTLIGYQMKDFVFRKGKNRTLTSETLYDYNLIDEQNFLNTMYYLPSTAAVMTTANDGTDLVAKLTISSTSGYLLYKKDPGASTAYKVSIQVKAITNACNIALTLIAPDGSTVSSTPATSGTGVWTTITHVFDSFDPIMVRVDFSGVTNPTSVLLKNFAVRRTWTITHTEGFKEVVVSNATPSTTINSPSPLVIGFKHNESGVIYPVQFIGTELQSPASLQTGFYQNNTITPDAQLGDVKDLIRPWTRRIQFNEWDPTHTVISKLIVAKKAGVFTSQFVLAESSLDLFQLSSNSTFEYNALFNDVEIGRDDNGILLNSYLLKRDGLNIEVSTAYLPIIETRFSMVNGCVDTSKFLSNKRENSIVAVTNVQILDDSQDDPTVLYEFEFAPIIYDESKHHISFNFLIRN